MSTARAYERIIDRGHPLDVDDPLDAWYPEFVCPEHSAISTARSLSCEDRPRPAAFARFPLTYRYLCLTLGERRT